MDRPKFPIAQALVRFSPYGCLWICVGIAPCEDGMDDGIRHAYSRSGFSELLGL